MDAKEEPTVSRPAAPAPPVAAAAGQAIPQHRAPDHRPEMHYPLPPTPVPVVARAEDHQQQSSPPSINHGVPVNHGAPPPPPAAPALAQASPMAPRLKTACSQCRRQKIKCRTSDELATPCERCAKMKLVCTSEPRNSKGRPRSESDGFMAGEQGMPKRRLVAKDGESVFVANERPFVSINSEGYGREGAWNPPYGERNGFERALPDPRTTAAAAVGALPERRSDYTSPVQTKMRSIDGTMVDEETIDGLFGQYFRHYHPFLPVLDSNLRPNDYYSLSPFLFWSIMAVASRRWYKTPTSITDSIRSKVLEHAKTTIFSPTAGSSAVTAILLLMTWSLPETKDDDEMPVVMASALVHAATRIGLDAPEDSQDFSRTKQSLTQSEKMQRFQIYIYCVILYNRASICMGNKIFDQSNIVAWHHRFYQPGSEYFQYRLCQAVVESSEALSRPDSNLATFVRNPSFDRIIQQGAQDLDQAEREINRYTAPAPPRALEPLESLYLAIVKLNLSALHFFKVPARENFEAVRPAYEHSCTVIRLLNDLEKSMHLDLYGTSYHYHSASLAACILLRCLKTPFADTVGTSSTPPSMAQALFFSAMNLIRNMSIAEGDKPSKCAWVLQQLWRSDTVFKHADGRWNLDLRVTTRFSASLIYDTMIWGREELKGQMFPGMGRAAPPPTDGGVVGLDPPADMAFPQDWVMSGWETERDV